MRLTIVISTGEQIRCLCRAFHPIHPSNFWAFKPVQPLVMLQVPTLKDPRCYMNLWCRFYEDHACGCSSSGCVVCWGRCRQWALVSTSHHFPHLVFTISGAKGDSWKLLPPSFFLETSWKCNGETGMKLLRSDLRDKIKCFNKNFGQRRGEGVSRMKGVGGAVSGLLTLDAPTNQNFQNCPPSENIKCASGWVGQNWVRTKEQRFELVAGPVINVIVLVIYISILVAMSFINAISLSCILTSCYSVQIIFSSSSSSLSKRISSGTKTQRCERLSAVTRLRRRMMQASPSSS